jgi:segregation and condensation protein A
MAETSFQIHLPQFDGPFDLLLFFIERDELDIQAIPIAKITNDFLEYINHLTALNVEVAADFILVAATLMRIKAKDLLPLPQADNEEDGISEEELIRRLLEYKKIKQQAEELKALEESRSLQVKRGNIYTDINLATTAHSNFTEEVLSFDLFKLLKVYKSLLSKYDLNVTEQKHIVVQYPFTIAQQKEIIKELLRINQKIDFNQLKDSAKSKVEMVYSFLAILEMVQEKLLEIEIGLGFNNFYVQQHTAPLQ